MSLIKSLKKAATKLGLIKVVTLNDVEKPAAISTRTVSLKELATELRAADVNALAAAAAEFSVSFDQVFAAAGVKTAIGEAGQDNWSIDKLHQLVVSEPYKDLCREKAQPGILTALAAAQVAVEDLVSDAMARDKAIDAYAANVFQKRQAQRRALSHKRIELQNQIRALQSQLDRLEDESNAADRQWTDWWQRKLAYEAQMAFALGYLLPNPIVTLDAKLPADENID